MASTAVLGSTGMVGAFLLSTLIASSKTTSITTLTRRAPPTTSTKLAPFVSTDTTTWCPHLSSTTPPPQILFSALATTRAAAGSFQAQYALEHDLNIALATAAKAAGTKVYVLISAANADANAFFAYSKMKGDIEDNIKALDFEHMIILRPGLIAGQREEKRAMEGAIRKIADVAGKISSPWLKDGWAQEADVIARAAVSAGLSALNGEAKDKVVVLGAKEIIRLGRTEWKES